MYDSEDIIVDVLVDGRVLSPKEIPPKVQAQIESALEREVSVHVIEQDGIHYFWSVRPCVFP